MHTVEAFEQAIAAAKRLGFEIRMEWLGGSGGGDCEIRGKRWLFVDLALNADEQLDQVLAAISREADANVLPLSLDNQLQGLLNHRKIA